MSIQQYELENRAYYITEWSESRGGGVPDNALMVVNENYRGAMKRSQPESLRNRMSSDNPNLSMNLGPDPFDERMDAAGQLHHDDCLSWLHNVDVDVLSGGWPLVDLYSNIQFNPNHETCFAQSVLGNYRAEYRHHNGAGNLNQILNQMPIQFERITREVEYHFNCHLDEDASPIGLTVMQVIGFDTDDNVAYGRIYQPKGASDDSSTVTWDSLSSKTLLSYPYDCSVGSIDIGDILVVPVSRWNGAGFILDAVLTTRGVPALHLRVDDECWRTVDHDNWRFATASNYSIRPDICYGRMGESGLVHYNKQEAHNFGIAMAVLMNQNETPLTGEVEVQEYWIPAWKDKRTVKIIDRASPFPAHYHDEIRCSACNGRVLIKLKGDNKSESADCPHCSRPKALLFPHLVSVQTDTLLTVGDTQRDDTHE